MTLLAPSHLWLMTIVGVIALAYLGVQLMHRRHVVLFPNLPLLSSIAPHRPGWRRHLTATAFLAMFAALVVAFAKPAHGALVPERRAVVIIAIDASRSMDADDVKPSRLGLAKDEATRFVQSLPDQVRVGIVVFSQQATLQTSPTSNRNTVVRAIASISKTSDGTAVGEAIYTALDALDHATQGPSDEDTTTIDPTRGGSHPAILIFSDGETTAGRNPFAAALTAKTASVPISTIAVGTKRGTVRLAGTEFKVPVQGDELSEVAKLARGHHYDVATTSEFQDIGQQIGADLVYRVAPSELTGWFLAGALGAGGLAVVGSLGWFSRQP
jgi:Ca-activated chloride channel family protein